MFSSNILPDIPENEIQINVETNKKIQDLPSFVTELDNDILSVTGTSSYNSDLSLNFRNNMECNVQASLGRSIDCSDKYSSSNADIGNISVESSADVTVGNKTFFNGPVVIKHFLANDVEQNSDPTETKTEHKGKSFDCLRTRPVLIGSILSAFVVIVIVVTVAVYFFNYYKSYANSTDTTDMPLTNETVDINYEFINRSQYGAEPSKGILIPIVLPANVIIIARTLIRSCTNYVECVDRILQVQRFHMKNNGWDDIGWHFLVGGDGKAYEGYGWYAISAIPNRYRMISISFIGNFSNCEASVKQLYAAQRFIEDGIRMNLINPEYIFYAGKNLKNESNYNMLYDQIIIWSSYIMLKEVQNQ